MFALRNMRVQFSVFLPVCCWSLLVAIEFSLGQGRVGLIGADNHGLLEQFASRAADDRELATPRTNLTTGERNEGCRTAICPERKRCQERNGIPRCTCKLPCTRDQRRGGPVCGSDGRTYMSLCSLYRQSCRATDGVIHVRHSGNCFLGSTRLKTGKKGGRVMSKILRTPVATVSSLRRKFRSKTQSIPKPHNGTDGRQVKATCHDRTCPRKQVCRERRGRARCTCKYPCTSITRRIGPVCGSDGRTYRTLCQLYRSDCRTENRDIYYEKPTSCKVDFKQYGNKPVPLVTKNELPAHFHVPTPPPGTLEELAFTAPQHMQPDLISGLLRFRIQETIRRKGLRRKVVENKTT